MGVGGAIRFTEYSRLYENLQGKCQCIYIPLAGREIIMGTLVLPVSLLALTTETVILYFV